MRHRIRTCIVAVVVPIASCGDGDNIEIVGSSNAPWDVYVEQQQPNPATNWVWRIKDKIVQPHIDAWEDGEPFKIEKYGFPIDDYTCEVFYKGYVDWGYVKKEMWRLAFAFHQQEDMHFTEYFIDLALESQKFGEICLIGAACTSYINFIFLKKYF